MDDTHDQIVWGLLLERTSSRCVAVELKVAIVGTRIQITKGKILWRAEADRKC